MSYLLDRFTRLPIRVVSRHVFIQCSFDSSNTNDSDNYALMVDTGCSVTTISSEVLKNIKHTKLNSKADVLTANGVAKMSEVRLNVLNIQGIKYSNMRARVANTLLPAAAAGILGMDILGRFNFFVDIDDNALYISKCQRKLKANTPDNIDDIAFTNTNPPMSKSSNDKVALSVEQLEYLQQTIPKSIYNRLMGI